MLDIPELDRMVFRQLGLHDLAQCARVSKKWHALVMPYLWHDLSDLSWDRADTDYFRRIVLEDYLAERRYQQLQAEEDSVEQSTQTQPSPQLSALSKYGYWIRLLPSPDRLKCALELPWKAKKQEEGPTEDELILHLFKRCSPDVQVDDFWMDTRDLNLELDNPKRAIAEFTLPRVRRLTIRFDDYSADPKYLKLLDQLDRCSRLEKLAFNVQIMSGMEDIMEDSIKNEPKGWTSLKKLTLTDFSCTTDSHPFWSRLFRRCSSLEKLRVKACYKAATNIEQGMLAYMPNICEISLGGRLKDGFQDEVIATLLGGSRKGWKVVKAKSGSNLGRLSMDALAKHFSTLEEVMVVDGTGYYPIDIVQVPRSCTKLCTLAYIDTYYSDMKGSSDINAEVFIDQDPDTGILKPWKCEASLKVLKVIIVGIPKPDSKGNHLINETYPGQGREIQGQVYDRLARLTNLETLWLGNQGRSVGFQSLKMTLDSGLGKLSGLKKLKEFNFGDLVLRIGINEVQWMVENWPKLRTIYGFGYGKEAEMWLKENHPEITVVRERW